MRQKLGLSSATFAVLLTLFVTGTALAYTAAAAGPTPTGVNASYAVAGTGSKVYTGGVVNAFTGASMRGVNVTVSGSNPVGRSRNDGYFEGRSSTSPALISFGLTGYTPSTIQFPKSGQDFGDVPLFANQFLTEIYSALSLGSGNKYQGGALVVDGTGAPLSGVDVEAATVTLGAYNIHYFDNNWGAVSMLTINRSGFSSPPSTGVTGDTGLAMNIGLHASSNKRYVLRAHHPSGSGYCTSLTQAPLYPAGYPAESSAVVQRTPGAVNLVVFVCD